MSVTSQMPDTLFIPISLLPFMGVLRVPVDLFLAPSLLQARGVYLRYIHLLVMECLEKYSELEYLALSFFG